MEKDKKTNIDYLQAKIKAYEKYLPQRIVEKINTNPYDTRVEGERRFVTILFGDVSGFTALSERLDPEEVIKVINKYFNKMLYIVEKYGGDVDKFVGDAIMVVFGAPVAHKDDPERAVRAALEMQEAIETIEPVYAKGEYIKVRMSIGINTGEIVALNMGTDERMEYTVMGDNVNLSARLEAYANATEVIISDRTYKYVKDIFDFEVREPIMVKGKKEPIPVYQALSVKDRKVSRRHIPVIGYDDELNKLSELIEGFLDNKAFSVSVIGDEGTGKSKMADYVYDRADRKNIDTLTFRGESFSRGVPLGAIKKAVMKFLKLTEGTGTDTVKAKIDNAFSRECRDGFYYLFALKSIDSLKKNILYASIVKSLKGLTDIVTVRNNLLLFIEDMHFMDASSIELIEMFFKDIQHNDNVSVFLTSRNDMDITTDMSIALKNLDSKTVKMLASEILGHAIDDAMARILYERTKGNPGYITELCEYLQSADLLIEGKGGLTIDSKGDMAIPDSLKSVFLEKMDKLPESMKQFIQFISVNGMRSSKADILSIYKLSESQIDDMFKQLVENNYLEFEGNDIYSFSSEMFRDAVYNSLMKNKRTQLHNSIGFYYEGLSKRVQDSVINAAYHYDHARNEIKAPVFLEKAGDINRALFAYREAYDMYSRSMEYFRETGKRDALNNAVIKAVSVLIPLRELKNAMETLETNRENVQNSDNDRAAFLNYRGLINDKMGNIEAAKQDYSDALSSAKSADNLSLLAKINNNMGILFTGSGDYENALKHFNAALSMSIREDKWHDIASQYINIGRVYAFMSDAENSEIFLKKAETILNEHDDKIRMIVALMNLAYVYDITGRKNNAHETYSRIVELAEAINDSEMKLKALNNIATMDYMEGELDKALKSFREIELIHRENDNIRDLAEVDANIAELLMSAGNLEESVNVFEMTLDLCDKCEHVHLKTYASVYYANALLLMGFLEKAESVISENISRSEKMKMPDFKVMSQNVLAKITGIAGDLDGEENMLRQALEVSEEMKNPDLIYSVKLTLVKTLIEKQLFDEAEKYAVEVLDYSRETGNEVMLSDGLATASDMYQRTNNIVELSNIASESFSIAEKTQNQLSALRNYLSLARFYLLSEDLTSCEEELKLAESKAAGIKSIEHTIALYSVLKNLYIKQNNDAMLEDAMTKHISTVDQYLRNTGERYAEKLLVERNFQASYSDFILFMNKRHDSQFILDYTKRFMPIAMKHCRSYMSKKKLINADLEYIL